MKDSGSLAFISSSFITIYNIGVDVIFFDSVDLHKGLGHCPNKQQDKPQAEDNMQHRM